MRREAYLDRGVGESRGVVTLDGRPERLLVLRDDDEPKLRLGAQVVGRIASIEPALATAFLDLGAGVEAILPFKSDAKPVRGQAVEVEIRAEPRRGKLAVARLLGAAEGPVGLIRSAAGIEEALGHLAKGAAIVEGSEARALADEAEAEVLEEIHPIPGGGVVAVEPTRALTAIDVDVGTRIGADAKRVGRKANLDAIALAARLLRLKGLGGIVVIDLVGRGHDGAALMAAARAAFAPDNPGVSIGPVNRFGLMEISLPRRVTPLVEKLCREDGAPSDRTLALRLARRLETEGLAQPGARIVGRCAPGIARELEPLLAALKGRMGSRFTMIPEASWPRDRLEAAAS